MHSTKMTNLPSNDIMTLADKLQKDDPEQFHTLVRMHLSFILDLNTDESDSVTEKVKNRPLKWRFVQAPFTKKMKNGQRGVMEGAPLTQEGICQVYQLVEYLGKEENICQEGIFRRTGKLTRQHELKSLLNSGVTLELNKSQFSVHDCASVLKSFLAELPEPLLTDAHYPAYCQIAEMCGNPGNETKLLRALQLLLLSLPTENNILLKDIIQLLHTTSLHESTNKMTADNLSTLFTPHLLCPRKLSPEAFHANSQTMSGVVAFMIRQGSSLFNIPAELAADIRAYWADKERLQMSPGKELDESISDGAATAATIFSFVDRESTAKAHAVNPTEAALAELYAHVQSLPESSNKRKLIKKYNKENGQGTPLQMQKNNVKGLSLGDSIKKHIFNKSGKRGKVLAEDSQVQTILEDKFNIPETQPNANTPTKSTDENSMDNSSSWNCLGKTCDTVKSPDANQQGHESMEHPGDPCDKSAAKESPPRPDEPAVPAVDLHMSLSPAKCPAPGPAFCTPRPPLAAPRPGLTPRNAWSAFLLTSTPAPALRPGDNSVLFTPVADDNNSMSPITRSTQRMPKSMQETMMTPRSRKPVIALSGTNLCQLASFDTWSADNPESGEAPKPEPKLFTIGENSPKDIDSNQNESDSKDSELSSSLTSTFRSYLCSRSVLTASPVDLSFTSRAGDFDAGLSSSSDKIPSVDAMTDSLLFCLDGNQPPSDSSEISLNNSENSKHSVDMGGSALPSRKRSARGSQSGYQNKFRDIYDDQSNEDKKCRIDKFLSASALMPQSNRYDGGRVHETSL